MEQADLIRHLIHALERLGAPYMLVGSIASGAYGEPRLTHDIDVVIDLSAAHLDSLCAAFPDSDFYLSRSAAHDAVARRSQFNIIHPESGNKIDVIVARRDAWGASQLQRRRTELILPDLLGCTASPDDIIIGKLLYYREGGSEKHLRDIVGILRVSGDQVDRSYITDWAQELGLSDYWSTVLSRHEAGSP